MDKFKVNSSILLNGQISPEFLQTCVTKGFITKGNYDNIMQDNDLSKFINKSSKIEDDGAGTGLDFLNCTTLKSKGKKGKKKKSKGKVNKLEEELKVNNSNKNYETDKTRNNKEYNPLFCPCRIWKANKNIGFPNIQCSKKLQDGASMCNMHAKKSQDGTWWLGCVNEDPPKEPMYRNGKPHFWTEECKINFKK
tara:strand:- start:2864 stop:3445 length:582 start_codon:yes stop_codon:yes gene_type:complete